MSISPRQIANDKYAIADSKTKDALAALYSAALRAEDRLTRTARDERDIDALCHMRAAIARTKELLA